MQKLGRKSCITEVENLWIVSKAAAVFSLRVKLPTRLSRPAQQ